MSKSEKMSDSGEVDEFFKRLGVVRSRLRSVRRKVVRSAILPNEGKNRPLTILNRRLDRREKELDSQRIGRGFNLSFNRPPPPPSYTENPQPPQQPPQPQSFPCSLCDQIFTSQFVLDEHMDNFHPEKEKIYV